MSKILIAPDSFKGSLTSSQAAAVMRQAVRKVLPGARITVFPLADGGEGTLEVLRRIVAGTYRTEQVQDPLGRPIKAKWLQKGRTAFLEMAQASGLTLVPPKERTPWKTTTFGTGQLVKKALKAGCRKIYIGVGGSATNDGGIGALAALGVRFYGKDGRLIQPGQGKDLLRIDRIDPSGLPSGISTAKFLILSDVQNPLYGKDGAAYVYAPQKGADARTVRLLDSGLRHYAEMLKKHTGRDVSQIPGSGAAGGISAGFLAFFNTRILSGIETILALGRFEENLKKADLFLTGEGKIDRQIAYGKALGHLFKLVQKYQVPTIAFAGTVEPEAYRLVKSPLIKLVPIAPAKLLLEESMQKAAAFLRRKTEEVLKIRL